VSLTASLAVGALAFASLGGIDVLGFGSAAIPTDPTILDTTSLASAVTDTQVTVSGSDESTTTGVGELPPVVVQPGATGGPTQAPRGVTSPAAQTPTSTPTGTAPAPTSPAAATPASTAPAVAPTVTAPATTPPATAAPTPATTAAPTNTVPPGARIPSDWPANKPIPPIPPGCVKPVLEDNGVWNCEH